MNNTPNTDEKQTDEPSEVVSSGLLATGDSTPLACLPTDPVAEKGVDDFLNEKSKELRCGITKTYIS